MSFEDRLLGGAGTWVGFANYAEILSNSGFAIQAAINTVVYTAFSVGIKFVIGMSMAAIVNHHIIWRDFWRGLLFLPWAVPAIVAAYTWKFIYDPDGFLNILLIDQLKVSSDFVNFLGDPRYALPTVILINCWRWIPLVALIIFSILQGIPRSEYEAARVEGAGRWAVFRFITYPYIGRSMTAIGLLGTLLTFNIFDLIWLLTAGGPVNRTKSLPVLIYEFAFGRQDLGAAAAASVLMFLMLLVFTLLYFRRRQFREE